VQRDRPRFRRPAIGGVGSSGSGIDRRKLLREVKEDYTESEGRVNAVVAGDVVSTVGSAAKVMPSVGGREVKILQGWPGAGNDRAVRGRQWRFSRRAGKGAASTGWWSRGGVKLR